MEKYEEGQRSGYKWNPAAVAMANIFVGIKKSEFASLDNEKREDKWSTSIVAERSFNNSTSKSYFSKLTSIRRQQSQSNMNTTPDQPLQTQSMDDVEVEEEHDEEDSNDDSDCDLLTQEFHRQKLRLEVNALLGMNALWDEEE